MEGFPKRQAPNPSRRWITAAIWLVGYLLLFDVFTVQDQLSEPQLVTYHLTLTSKIDIRTRLQ